jgi:ABC-type multidrug transport system permease subunit
MRLKRLNAMFVARNREFFRDKAAFGWNFLFPFLIIAGFAILFGGREHKELKVGIYPCPDIEQIEAAGCPPSALKDIKYIEHIFFSDQQVGLDKLKHHKIDILVEVGQFPWRYWVCYTSPKGYIAEKIIQGVMAGSDPEYLARQEIETFREIRYIDWLFPGILAMNMMFSALYGVGFVVVRYRKNGVLKRLKATPLTAFEYLSAQMFSRLFLLMFSLAVLWIGCDLVFDFHMVGSYFDLSLMFLAGCLSLTSLGLIIASRGTSEEFANGLLNFITWPMMFLSEVWFSIEGAPHWVKMVSKVFPLTHLLTGVRKIMNDGATLIDVGPELVVLFTMTLLFLTIGAGLFSWNR